MVYCEDNHCGTVVEEQNVLNTAKASPTEPYEKHRFKLHFRGYCEDNLRGTAAEARDVHKYNSLGAHRRRGIFQ